MYNLVNSNFNRTYNPSGQQNALSEIKRLLTSRDTSAQNKACGYLIEVISRYNRKAADGDVIEYLLDNDITVFLCEATTNLDLSLFRSITSCIRLLWRSPRFFCEEHAAQATSAVLRALAHYTGSGPTSAVDACLHFLCDLLNGIHTHKSTPPLSHQSAYSAVQLLACLNSLSTQVHANSSTVLASALVLEALIGYQPDGLYITSNTAKALIPVLSTWIHLLLGALQHAALTDLGASGDFGANTPLGANGGSGVNRCNAACMSDMRTLYIVACTVGGHALRLTKLLHHGNKKVDFVQAILVDDQDVNVLKQCSVELASIVNRVISELVLFTKDHESQIPTEEYGVFLNFLLSYFHETKVDGTLNFCEMLLANGYLTMLPQTQIARNDLSIRKASTLVLGELLKVLADTYLKMDNIEDNCAKDIHMGIVDLQYGIEQPQSLGSQLQKSQPYTLLVYIYFYCQSSDNPEEATGPLLPYLVEHILALPKSFRPPAYIIKALWLVFAMSSISNTSLASLEERVYLEKATERFVSMLKPEPSKYYTHNPGILLWAFTSERITMPVKFHVVSEWLKLEPSLPPELTVDPAVWELLLNILVHSTEETVLENCMKSLQLCLEDDVDEFAGLVWGGLPDVLARALIEEGLLAPNICYLLDLAATLQPTELDSTLCLKTAVLITAIFSKNENEPDTNASKCYFEYVCLKLCLYLLTLANGQNDFRVLLTYVDRVGFLPSVLSVIHSVDDKVACAAMQLLCSVVHYYTKNNYQPKTVLQIQTALIIQSFRRDSYSERGASLLQLVYIVLNSGVHTPLALGYDMGDTPVVEKQCNALRCMMFRIQLLLCTRSPTDQSSAAWKTLSSIFKHAVVTKKDVKLVGILTSQPWTFILVQFHISQTSTAEFLTFLQNWLTFLKITVEEDQTEKKELSQYSLVTRTMVMIRKKLKGDDGQKELVQNINSKAREILCGSSFTGRYQIFS